MRSSLWICVLSLLTLGPPTTSHAGVLGTTVGAGDYSGSRTTSNGLTGNQGWADGDGGFKLNWTISQDPGTMVWTYRYTLRNADGTPLAPESSHSILQLSETFAESDFINRPFDPVTGGKTEIEVKTHTIGDPGNPGPVSGPPVDIYGVKFNESNWDDIEFTTLRDPVWGNFYAKDGGGNTAAGATYVYNNGLVNAASSSSLDFVPTPDSTASGTVPEPASLALWGFGLLAGGGLARRRRRQA